MNEPLIVHGQYIGRTFIPDGPLPDTEGAAELVITPKNSPPPGGSIADAFGKAATLRTGDELLSQIQAERAEWDNR